MRVVVDTRVFSASLSRRRRVRFEPFVSLMAGNQIFLAAVTVSELRYGALVAEWGDQRRQRLEAAIQATTVIPVSDDLLSTIARLRHGCRVAGHPLHERSHANDLWIAASAIQTRAALLTADNIFDGAMSKERCVEECSGGHEIASAGHVHVDDPALFIDGSVDVPPFPGNLPLGLVDEPAATNGVAAWSGGVDEEGSEALNPSVDGDVVYLDPTFDEEFFDISIRESVAEVPAHSEHDHLRRKPVAGER